MGYGQFVEAASFKYKIPTALIHAIIAQESGGDPNAHNAEVKDDPNDDSFGLMQVTKNAAADGLGYYGPTAKLYDPAFNIMAGTAYLAWLRDNFSPVKSDYIAAYNRGLGKTKRGGPYVNNRYVMSVLIYESVIAMKENFAAISPLLIPAMALLAISEVKDRITAKGKDR